MELKTKTAFKQTEVGVIPEDWNLVPFDKVFTFYSTSNYSKAQMSEEDDVGCIHYGLIHAISNTQYDLNDGIKYYVSSEQTKYELVRDGDVIMVDASEDLEGINKSVEVFGVNNKKYISGLHTYLLRDKGGLLADKFRGIVLNSQLVKNQMLQLAVGMKVFGVSKSQIIKVKIPLPPTLQEQKAIATALSDVDALIQGLEALIAKKKDIKQGAMQELLTPPHKGGKRLPGFTDEWVEKRLENVGEIITGGTPSTFNNLFWGGDIPWVTPTDIGENKDISECERYLSKDGLKAVRKLPKDSLLVTCIASIGKNAILRKDGACNQQINAVVPNELNNVDFLYYLIELNNNVIKSKAGITATLMVSKKVFSDISFDFPPTLEEQNDIAKILSDMDIELEQLEIKKAKYQDIKQGMMQELLTGKTRLI